MTNTMKLKNKKGFTLTELIVVIVIIGILAAVLIPSLTGYIEKANKSAAEQEAAAYVEAYSAWLFEKTAETTTDTFVNYAKTLVTDKSNCCIVSGDENGFVYCSNKKYHVTYSKTNSSFSTTNVSNCNHSS